MNYFTDAKPYNSLNEYYRIKYGHKVAKIALNAKFTCPNRDGKKGYGGCTYCSRLLSGDFAGDLNKPLKEQFDEIKTIMECYLSLTKGRKAADILSEEEKEKMKKDLNLAYASITKQLNN